MLDGILISSMLSRSRQIRDIEISRPNLKPKYFKYKQFFKTNFGFK